MARRTITETYKTIVNGKVVYKKRQVPATDYPFDVEPARVGDRPTRTFRKEGGKFEVPTTEFAELRARGKLEPAQEAEERRQDVLAQQEIEKAAEKKFPDEISEEALSLFQKYRGQPLPPEVLAAISPFDLDAYQALSSAAGLAGTGFAAGAAVGATAGAVTTGGLASLPAALIIGGVTSVGVFVGALQNNIKSQIAGEIKAVKNKLPEYEKAWRFQLTAINQNENPLEIVKLFYETIADFQESHAKLRLQHRSWITRGLGSDATKELGKYDSFEEHVLPQYELALQKAILNPDPNTIFVTAEEILAEAEEKNL